MHESSFAMMSWLLPEVVKPLSTPLNVLDLGSFDVNGSYRSICEAIPGLSYMGADMAPGPNVDLVMANPYLIPRESATIDLVISGQAFEHIEFPWLTIREIERVLVPNGAAIIIAPSSGPEHRFPQDCWRFYPDGMRALGKWGRLDCIDVWTNWVDAQRFGWGDTVAVFWKRPTVESVSPFQIRRPPNDFCDPSELATEANFNEEGYLAINPDVAKAVRAGAIGSAQAHFDAYGKAEGRRQRSNVAQAGAKRSQP